MSTFDFATLDTTSLSENGAEMVLCHPSTEEELDAAITLAGMDSAHYRKAEARLSEKYRQQKGKKLTPEMFRHDAAGTLAACTLDWRNIHLEGVDLPCTKENAKMLYLRFPWIFEQGQKFISARENYLRDSLTTCAEQ